MTTPIRKLGIGTRQSSIVTVLVYGLLILVLVLILSASGEVVFESGEGQTALVELYTSQGCSSCPPAEKWISGFLDDPRLWKSIVPIAFHVTYWDYIGWKDPFAADEYGRRQRQYYKSSALRSVYTPGVVVNGKEWRGWRAGGPLPKGNGAAGNLVARLDEKQLDVTYSKSGHPLDLHVAVLGFGAETHVTRGENKNRDLKSDFTVLSHIVKKSKDGTWQVQLPRSERSEFQKYALAIWVSDKGSLEPLQATGSFL